MSAVSDAAKGHIMIADFVNLDAAGKVNILGGSVQFLGYDPEAGVTAPFSLYVEVAANVPAGEDTTASMEILLVDIDGQPVDLPGPAGPQTMRIAQNVDFRVVAAAGMPVPPPGFPGRTNAVLNFFNGLPLPPGKSYEWVIQLDHELIAKTAFVVPGPPNMPVLG